MTNSYQGGRFDFEESGDYSQNLINSFGFTNRGDQRIDRMLQRNWKVDEAKAGEVWRQLEKFSPTAFKALGQVATNKENAKKAKIHLWYKLNKGEGLDESIKRWEDFQSGNEEAYKDVEKITKDDPKIPWYTKKQFRDMTNWERGLIYDFQMQSKAAEYNVHLSPEAMKANGPDERAAVIEAGQQKFYEQFGDEDPGRVYDNVTKVIEPIQAAADKRWNAERERSVREEQINLAGDLVLQGIHSGKTERSWEKYLSHTIGLYGNKAKAREGYNQIVKNIVSDPKNGESKLTAIGDQIIDGVKLKDHHAWKTMFREWGQTFDDAVDAKAKQKRDDIQTWSTNKRFEVLDEVVSGPPKPDKYYDDLTQEFIDKTGEAPAWIATLKKNKSIRGKAAVGFRSWATQLRETDNLTMDWLRRPEIPKVIFDEFKEHAKAQDELRNKNDLYDASSFQTLAETNLGPDIKAHTSVKTLGKIMHSRFKAIRREMAAAGIVDDGEKAYKRIDDWFKASRNSLLTHNGYKLGKLEDETYKWKVIGGNHSTDTQDKINYMKDAIGSLAGKALDTKLKPINGVEATPFGTKQFFIEISKGYGTPGFKLHPRMAWVAEQYRDPKTGHKLHPLAVLNIQRKTLNLPELGQTDDQILFNRLSAQAKAAALNNKQNSLEINARAGLEIYDPDPNVKGDEYIVEKKFDKKTATEIIKSSEENKMASGDVSAAYYAIAAGLDPKKVAMEGTWENSQYKKYQIFFNNDRVKAQQLLKGIRLRTNR